MYWAKLATFAVIGGLPAIHAQTAARMLRFACSQLVVERLDPLVSSGILGSPHTHQIVGGNSFNATMTPVVYDLPTRSNCTSCTFSEDFSNYWTATMYYRAKNGTYKRVQQFPNGGLTQNGGITVYYIPPYDGVTNVTAFKPVSDRGDDQRYDARSLLSASPEMWGEVFKIQIKTILIFEQVLAHFF
jgi:Domain of unknown function (DUF1996)